jgi:hypothetical protein
MVTIPNLHSFLVQNDYLRHFGTPKVSFFDNRGILYNKIHYLEIDIIINKNDLNLRPLKMKVNKSNLKVNES